MGCKASKGATTGGPPSPTSTLKQRQASPEKAKTGSPTNTPRGSKKSSTSSSRDKKGKDHHHHSLLTKTSSDDSDSKVYKLLLKAQQQQQGNNNSTANDEDWNKKIMSSCTPKQASYRNPTTGSTPLHMACRLLDVRGASGVAMVLQGLLQAHPDATRIPDVSGNIPLHYAIAPTWMTHTNPQDDLTPSEWTARTAAVKLLMQADPESSRIYLSRNNILFDSQHGSICSPLYRALQTLPDDFTPTNAPTVEFIHLLRPYCNSEIVAVGNASDGDKPLALLYRRFTRQFDLAEKFFAGDNSRPEVVQHRQRYKTAAGNTWKIIELLLRPDLAVLKKAPHWRIVHRAVQVETPPDLLRYIVETNAEDLTVPDHEGNLPLHYAAKSKPPVVTSSSSSSPPEDKKQFQHFPAFYTKYVVDELLYKFPEAASIPDANGQYPLTLAVRAGKQWIGGGIKSLFDAYPPALKQINLKDHIALQRVLSLEPNANRNDGDNDVDDDDKEEKLENDIIRDEQHDAIMLVQQPDVDVTEVVTSMWAHEEDAGVQMLGCVAISKMLARTVNSPKRDAEALRIALTAVAGVVNAMKAHPNEVIVQEKACQALQATAQTDGHREISFVASGAVAAIVGAMQAHVSDPGVQQEACAAVAAIIHYGGDDRATVVASVSGVTAIVNAIAAHPDEVEVQKQACRALVELTNFPTANLPELPRSQTEPLLMAVKKKFPEECGALVDTILVRLSA